MKNVKIFDEKLQIAIPTGFKDASSAYIERHYGHGVQPQIVKVREKDGVTMSVSRIRQEVKEEDLLKELQRYDVLYHRGLPGYEQFGIAEKEIHGHRYASMQYKCFALARDLYNFMVMGSLEGMMLLLQFHCTYGEYETWRPVFLEITESLEILSNAGV